MLRPGMLVTLVFLEIGGSHTSSRMRLDPGAGSTLLPVVRKSWDVLVRRELVSEQVRRKQQSIALHSPGGGAAG